MSISREKDVVDTQIEDSLTSSEKEHVAIKNDTFAIDEDALGTNLPKGYYRSPGFIGTITALCLGNISNYTGFVLPANLLTNINQDIGPSANIAWVSLSYTLGLAVGFLVVGRLSDIFGRRWFFILGNGMGLIGSIICAVAKDVNTVIGGDILLGLAGAVQISFAIAVSELVPNKHRPIVVPLVFASSFQIACFGPVIAQALVANTEAQWRWCYYINIIVSGLATVAFYFFYHPPNFHLLHTNRTKRQQLARQDFVGFVLFVGGLMLFIMGLSWGGVVYPWKSGHVIATIVVGFVCLATFVLYDAFLHKGDPLMPTHLLKSPGYLAIVMTGCIGSCVYYSMNVLWPQQIAYLFPGSLIHNGWLACTVGGACLLGQVIGGGLCRYIKQTRTLLIVWCFVLLAFCAAMVSINPGEEAKGVALMFMACFSVGVIETCSLALAPLALPSEDIGAALGLLGSLRSGLASVATAIYVTILNNKLTAFVGPAVSKAALNAGLPSTSLPRLLQALSTGVFTDVPGIDDSIIAAVGAANSQAAADAFRYVWYAVIAFACLAVFASFLCIDYGDYLTPDVARKMHGKTVHDDTKHAEQRNEA